MHASASHHRKSYVYCLFAWVPAMSLVRPPNKKGKLFGLANSAGGVTALCGGSSKQQPLSGCMCSAEVVNRMAA